MAVTTEHITVNDFDQICRTCCSSHNLQNINGLLNCDFVSIEFILNKYTEVEFNCTDNLPKQICSTCVENFVNVYTFLNNCNLVHKALRESSVQYVNNLEDKICEPSVKKRKCEIKEEHEEIFQSMDSQDDDNTENATDIGFGSVKVENLHSVLDIKEEPHIVDDGSESDYWNMDDDDVENEPEDQNDDEIEYIDTSRNSADSRSEKNKLKRASKRKYSKNYQCDKCLAYFSHKLYYIRHVAGNCESKSFQMERIKCEVCNREISKSRMVRHMMIQHSVPKKEQNIADKALEKYFDYFPKPGRLVQRIKCRICSIEVHTGYMEKHMHLHNRTQFQCDKCKVYFGSEFFLNEHVTKCNKVYINA